MITEIKSPTSWWHDGRLTVFLAGSIEMGQAEDWQKRLIKSVNDPEIVFLNPRRDDWDSSWKQDINDPQFNEQVNWELDSMRDADVILFYFSPETKSPITLMELGLYANSDKPIIVCCPHGFWRKGNVDIVCDREKVVVYDNFDQFLDALPTAFEFGKRFLLTNNLK